MSAMEFLTSGRLHVGDLSLGSWSPWTIFTTTSVPLLGIALIRILYNLALHPLSRHPGPWYAGATDFSYRTIVASGNLVTWLQAQHAKHGPILRVGPGRLSFIEAEAWKDIYGHSAAGRKPNGKDPHFYAEMDIKGHHSILTETSDVEHGQVRRIFSHAFSDKALKEQQPLLTKYVDQLVGNVKQSLLSPDSSQKKDTFDVVKLYNFTTFDIMADLTFGESLGLLRTSSYSDWVKNVFASIRLLSISTIWRETPWLNAVYNMLEPRFINVAVEAHNGHSVERVKRRLQQPVRREDGHVDIWTRVLSQPEGRGLAPEKMHSNASIFMLAGTETTATLLSGVTYHLLLPANRDKLERLKREIRSAFRDSPSDGGEGGFTLEGLQRLKYLTACLEEGLRLYPPVPSPLWRVTPEGEGNVICGVQVPGGMRVAVPGYVAYRSERNFRDADEFVPERWLFGDGEDAERKGYYEGDRREALQPFSLGPRNCLGKNLAYHEMRLILAKMMWHFDMSLCPESENWNRQKVFLMWEKRPLMVKMALSPAATKAAEAV